MPRGGPPGVTVKGTGGQRTASQRDAQIASHTKNYAQNPGLHARALRGLGVPKDKISAIARASKYPTIKKLSSKNSLGLQNPVKGAQKALETAGLSGAAHPIRRAEQIAAQASPPRQTRPLNRISPGILLFPGFGKLPGLGRLGSKAASEGEPAAAAKGGFFRSAPKPRAVPKMPADMPPEVQASAKKITAGLSFGGAKKAVAEQEALRSVERAKRAGAAEQAMVQTPGVQGAYAARHELRGALPKVQFDALKGKFGDKEVQDLFTYVSNHEKLRPYEKVATHRALIKAFAGELPANYERKLLHKAFGPEFTKSLQDAQSTLAHFKALGLDVANIPRSLMASYDVSAPFRQGLVAGARHPVMFSKNFPLMLKQFGSERVHQETMNLIHENPLYQDGIDHGLSLTELGGSPALREEQFPSGLAERIPVAGRGVRMSNRAYVGFLDKMRMDMYAHHVEAAQKFYGGSLTAEQKRGLTDFINNATGRGSLGRFQNAAVHLNTLFFSPRLLASRVNLLNPMYYARLDPYSRRQALRAMTGLVGFVGSVLYLAKLGGARVSTDPRNADFAKMRIGNSRLDLLGGFQQPVRLASQLVSGKVISSTTGDTLTLGPGFGQMNRQDIAKRFFEGKLAPTPSVINDLMKGTDFQGNPLSVKNEAAGHLVPLAIQDAHDLYKSTGSLPLALGGYAGSATGLGVQTYGARDQVRTAYQKWSPQLKTAFAKAGEPKVPKVVAARLNLRIERAHARQALGRNATSAQKFSSDITLIHQHKGWMTETEAQQAKAWAKTASKGDLRTASLYLTTHYFDHDGLLRDSLIYLRKHGSPDLRVPPLP